MKSKVTKISPLMSEAFMSWLGKIGYRGVCRGSGETQFYCGTVNQNFPRGETILANGKLNKVAARLYKEFEEHLEA
ncbi:MAG: hypothetical protein ACN6NX_11570 [Acinetobacter sp.]